MSGILEQLDASLATVLSDWDSTSSLLLLGIGSFIAWTLFDAQDADTHPLLLARQSQASYVRQPGESAVYRSPEVPHGYPLKTGLSVKAPGAPAYAAGKDGDLRYIWRRVTGEIPLVSQSAAFFQGVKANTTDEPTSKKGKIQTVFGRTLDEHDIAELTREINVIGKHLKQHGAKRVALYLPNSVEYLAAIFAGAFYGFSTILIPFNQPLPELIALLKETKADALVSEAGSFPLADVSSSVPGLTQVVWVVEKTSRHMDWNEVPEGIGGALEVSTWHDIIQDSGVAPSLEVPQDSEAQNPSNIVVVWLDGPGQAQIIEFTQANIVAAVGAALSALPAGHRMTSSDTFLPAESFAHSQTLVLTLAALFSHTTLVLNSVAGTGVEIDVAAQFVSPTIISASAESIATLQASSAASSSGPIQKFARYLQGHDQAAGRMPGTSMVSRINTPTRIPLGATPGALRLLFVSERAGSTAPPVSAHDLSDLRISTGARVAYALTAPRVFGAVAQTNIYDYRTGTEPRTKHSHFGVPLSSVEVRLRDTAQLKTSDEKAVGEIVVSGPAVAGGEAALGVNGQFRDDHTLAYL